MEHKASMSIKAVVTLVDRRRSGKEYAVTKLTESSPRPTGLPLKATVTFSLSEWSDKHPPENGQLVILEDIVKFARGWRARAAKPVRA